MRSVGSECLKEAEQNCKSRQLKPGNVVNGPAPCNRSFEDVLLVLAKHSQ